MKPFLLICAFFTFAHSFSQKQNNQWRFGYGSGINFNTSPATSVTGLPILTQEGSASVANPVTGDLLFYTDGVKVWNAQNQIMPNGNGLQGGTPQLLSSTTAAIIVPRPGNCNQYYIITVDEGSSGSSSNGICYSLVDMSLNGGLGDIVPTAKNIPLLSTTSEKAEVIPAANGTDYWIVSHDFTTFYSFLLTSAGFQASPVVSLVSGNLANTAGHLKVNRQFNRLACGSLFESKISLFSFDHSTGVVSDITDWQVDQSMLNTSPLIYGLEFSPGGQFLYVSNLFSIVQYDVSVPNPVTIANSAFVLNVASPLDVPASIQLGPDSLLYVNNGSIWAIRNPDLPGAACNYQPTNLSGGGYGLPKWVYSSSAAPDVSILSADSCLQSGRRFSLSDTTAIQAVVWQFNDPASGANNTSTALNPLHVFTSPGTYAVSATVTTACGTFQLTDTVVVIDCSAPCTGLIIAQDSCVQIGTTFSLSADQPVISVVWQFNDPASGANNTSTAFNPLHVFTSPGTYAVSATVTTACGTTEWTQSVSVINCEPEKPCAFMTPNVFSPNQDGINDLFIPFSSCPFAFYLCTVFNRWGEKIFQTYNPAQGWDGTYRGEACIAGVYIYAIEYRTDREESRNINGSVTLLR